MGRSTTRWMHWCLPVLDFAASFCCAGYALCEVPYAPESWLMLRNTIPHYFRMLNSRWASLCARYIHTYQSKGRVHFLCGSSAGVASLPAFPSSKHLNFASVPYSGSAYMGAHRHPCILSPIMHLSGTIRCTRIHPRLVRSFCTTPTWLSTLQQQCQIKNNK